MALRTENGWYQVGADACEWTTIPGTGVTLQIQKGWPLAILRAFAADFNAYVEPLRDPDSACWTPTNSVATSNHLSGTAMDLNWNSHPFKVLNAGFNSQQIATIRELLAFYEDTVWWGNDWISPKDAMHFNMSYNTYDNPHTGDFIARKIRADGFSTFRRGNAPVVSVKDQHALDILHEGQRRGISERGLKIALATALVESNITIYANERVPASMSIPHEAVGSDAYSVGIFQQQVRDTGNGWWWGDAATCMDPTLSAGLFFDRLARLDYNGPNSPGSYAQDVQDSAFPDRYDERFAEAEQLYNRLISLGDDELSADAERMIRELHACLFNTVVSNSPYRDPKNSDGSEPDSNTWQLHELIKNDDGMYHMKYVEDSARSGDPAELARVIRAAQGLGAVRTPDFINRARRVLNEIEATNPQILQTYLAQNGTQA